MTKVVATWGWARAHRPPGNRLAATALRVPAVLAIRIEAGHLQWRVHGQAKWRHKPVRRVQMLAGQGLT